jgi:hypothetical protein
LRNAPKAQARKSIERQALAEKWIPGSMLRIASE